MKLLKKDLEKDGAGEIALICGKKPLVVVNSPPSFFASFCPEESEDLWATYNLINTHDRVSATTIRKVQLFSRYPPVLYVLKI